MKFWHPNPKHPARGIQLFDYTRDLLRTAGIPHVIENVRSAQQFVGSATAHCGPFYLWGNAVPPLLMQGITKGSMLWSERYRNMKKSQRKREVAEIPPELASCVADYADNLAHLDEGTIPECSSCGKPSPNGDTCGECSRGEIENEKDEAVI